MTEKEFLGREPEPKPVTSMTIADLIREAHATAVEKGWWQTDRPFSEGIALMHSELSEALEEWRAPKKLNGEDNVADMMTTIYVMLWDAPVRWNPNDQDISKCKPEGIAVELADILVRIGDWCGKHNIPLEAALVAKIRYNKIREFRHGGKIA